MKKEQTLMDKIQIAAELNFVKINRVNFSKQADEIVEKIKKGIRPTSTEYFILLNTNQEQIDQLIKYDEIVSRMESGRMTYKDVDFLLGMIGPVGELEKPLKNTLYKKLDQVNLGYARENKDEFSEKEIKALEKKCKNSTVEETLKEELEEIFSC